MGACHRLYYLHSTESQESKSEVFAHEFETGPVKDLSLNVDVTHLSRIVSADCLTSGLKHTRRSSPSYATPWCSTKPPGSVQTTTCPWSPSSTGTDTTRERPTNFWAWMEKDPLPPFSRSVFLKYADRGLVNDRYYYNMNMSLFNGLFWFSNIFLFAINQAILWVHFFKYGESPFKNAYR